jgi:hypothetical protein
LARAAKMYRVPQAGPRQPAVAGPVVKRGVRQHPHSRCDRPLTTKPVEAGAPCGNLALTGFSFFCRL